MDVLNKKIAKLKENTYGKIIDLIYYDVILPYLAQNNRIIYGDWAYKLLLLKEGKSLNNDEGYCDVSHDYGLIENPIGAASGLCYNTLCWYSNNTIKDANEIATGIRLSLKRNNMEKYIDDYVFAKKGTNYNIFIRVEPFGIIAYMRFYPQSYDKLQFKELDIGMHIKEKIENKYVVNPLSSSDVGNIKVKVLSKLMQEIFYFTILTNPIQYIDLWLVGYSRINNLFGKELEGKSKPVLFEMKPRQDTSWIRNMINTTQNTFFIGYEAIKWFINKESKIVDIKKKKGGKNKNMEYDKILSEANDYYVDTDTDDISIVVDKVNLKENNNEYITTKVNNKLLGIKTKVNNKSSGIKTKGGNGNNRNKPTPSIIEVLSSSPKILIDKLRMTDPDKEVKIKHFDGGHEDFTYGRYELITRFGSIIVIHSIDNICVPLHDKYPSYHVLIKYLLLEMVYHPERSYIYDNWLQYMILSEDTSNPKYDSFLIDCFGEKDNELVNYRKKLWDKNEGFFEIRK